VTAETNKCENCGGTGFHGPDGPGILGNTQCRVCECLRGRDPDRLVAALITATDAFNALVAEQARLRNEVLGLRGTIRERRAMSGLQPV